MLKTESGLYRKIDLKKLSEEALIQILIDETSHQKTMNVIRNKFNDEEKIPRSKFLRKKI